MGLFKKRQQTQEELEAMRAEMRSLREHLAKTDAVRDQLAARLGHLDAENERLNAHVGTVQAQVGEVATKVGSVEHEVVTVAGSIGPTVDYAIKAAAGASPTTDDVEGLRNEVRHHLDDLAAAVQRQQTQIADVAIVATDAAERSEQTDAKIDGFTATDDRSPIDTPPSPAEVEAKRQLGLLAEKVAALDARVHQVSLELTNQLTELSTDLDRAGEHADSSELIDRINAQLDGITGGQERLANEQARYAIQFRSDLADLADRQRRK
ncbi:MAG: hypothetical protein WA964_13145 [Ilumatobacter sp.]|uniref:hypothetical protein n=1 Tax=Ilumatobacter sp. TaxID=1967498 RepID=UPI003C7187E2